MAKKPSKADLIAQQKKLSASANRSYNAVKKYRNDHPDDVNNDALLEMQERFRQQKNDLLSDTIRIFDIDSKGDLEKINDATKEIDSFIGKIETVEKIFVVAGAALDFFGAALTGNPEGIVKAAIAVIDAFEKEKGDQPLQQV